MFEEMSSGLLKESPKMFEGKSSGLSKKSLKIFKGKSSGLLERSLEKSSERSNECLTHLHRQQTTHRLDNDVEQLESDHVHRTCEF